MSESVAESRDFAEVFCKHTKMQRPPATMEEQLMLKAIAEECPWESLPKRLQSTLSSKEEWHRRFGFLLRFFPVCYIFFHDTA